MTKRFHAALLLTILLSIAAMAVAAENKAPTTQEQMHSLEAMCEASAEARTARHAASPLYDRLGGYDRIQALTAEVVRLHQVNDAIKHTLDGVDPVILARLVGDFLAAGTGGTVEYTGRDLKSSHAHLKLTDADFLSAGSDIMQAMKNLGYGEDEIGEVVCLLVSLKNQVVFE